VADPRDERVSGAYRELPGDGPSPALDAAIQAAARRAVGSRPGHARRWQIPVSIAAVLALAIGVSLQVDREKPMVADGTPFSSGSAEYPVPQAAPEKEEPAAPPPQTFAPAASEPAPLAKETSPRPAQAPMPAPEAKRFAPEPPLPASPPAPAPAAAPEAAAARPPMPSPSLMNVAPAPAAAPPAAAGAVAPAEAMRAAPQPAPRAKKELARDATTQEKVMTQALETPERRLERIADLRAKGLHDEADRALAEFRRAYPDYRLGEEWLRRVERR